MEKDLSYGLSDDELSELVTTTIICWFTGVQALNSAWGAKYEVPNVDDLLSVLDDVLEDIVFHRNAYNICISDYDHNKLVNYFAWHLRKKFESASLFFGHLYMMDHAVKGVTLRGIPHLPLICENLQRFHMHGEKLAPYSFMKGLDLTLNHCTQAQCKTWCEPPAEPKQAPVPPPPASAAP